MGLEVLKIQLFQLKKVGMVMMVVYVRQINKNFKLIFLEFFLLHHVGNAIIIHMLFEF